MDVEAVINLFDSCWFSSEIFKKHPNTSPSSNSEPYQAHQNEEKSPKPSVSYALAIHTRSKSYDSVPLSPDSVLFRPHLETIPSGVEAAMEDAPRTPQQKKNGGRRRRTTTTRKGLSKSLSELEYEELKGFMDLGFEFSEEDRNSSLVEIIPGLQRLGKQKDGDSDGDDQNVKSVERPYLSEAWEGLERKKIDNPLMMKWRFPAMSNENDMKDNLKWWAHTVASTVH